LTKVQRNQVYTQRNSDTKAKAEEVYDIKEEHNTTKKAQSVQNQALNSSKSKALK